MSVLPETHKNKGESMNELFIISAFILAILALRSLGQQEEVGAYATARQDSDNDDASDVSNGSMFDDNWMNSSMADAGSTTDWTTDPAYAFLVGNIYHNTPMDPTRTDWNEISNTDESCSPCSSESDTNLFDDSFSNSSSFDDTFSSSSFDDSFSSCSSDDSWSDNSFSDSFSSSSFND